MLRIGVVGTGTMGRAHLESWANISGAQIVGIVGRDKKSVNDLSEKYNSHPFIDYQQLLLTDVDLIDICLPTYLHKAYISKAAQSGKHVICEKPLALDIAECNELIETCKKYRVQLFVGHTLRFSPEYRLARDHVIRGAVGKPGVIRLSRGGPYPQGRNDWYNDQAKSGGIILDLGIHDFDWVRWTCGEVERVMAKKITRKRGDGSPIEYALITLRMESGTIVHIELSWAKNDFESAFEIAGNKGMISHNDQESYPIKLQVTNDCKMSNRVALPDTILTKTPLQQQLEHFMICLETSEEPIVSAEDAKKAIEIALAASESAEIGQPISLLEKKEVF